MISIIICSRTKRLAQTFLNNIENTIGEKYELVVIDNSENKHSIFEAYNLGIEKSKGTFCCFVHDDVIFHTKNWGLRLKEIFENDPKVGLVGVAGSKVKTRMPSAWWECPDTQKIFNLIQHRANCSVEKWNSGFENANLVDVAVIDGVFMAVRKSDKLVFDISLRGFHNYDLNISFDCWQKNKRVVVSNKILIEHFSIGKIDESWVQSVCEIHSKYSNLLPVVKGVSLAKRDFRRLEIQNGIRIIYKLMELNYKKQAVKLWFLIFKLKPISKFHFKFLKKIAFECLL